MKKFSLLILVVLFIITIFMVRVQAEKPFLNSKYMEIEGIKFHYRVWKPEDNIVKGNILMVHGLGGSTFSWRKNVYPLKNKGYRILAVDLPAFGYSDRKEGLLHTQQNRSKWLWKFIQKYEKNKGINYKTTWHLIGHSMGGATVTAMAIEKPEKVDSLIIIAGAVLNNPPAIGKILNFPPLEWLFKYVVKKCFFTEQRIKNTLYSAYGKEPNAKEIASYLKPLLIEGTLDAWVDLIKTASDINENKLTNLSIPVLLIWGKEDRWVPLKQGIRLNKLFSNSKLRIIEDSGHCPMETDSSIVNQYILSFID